MLLTAVDSESSKAPFLKFGAVFFLAMLIVSVFHPLLRYDFVCYDDETHVLENPFIRSLSVSSVARMFTSTYVRSYYPVRNLSLAVDYSLWGLNPGGYHLTNVILHFLNALLVGLIAYRAMPGSGAMPGSSSVRSLLSGLVAATLFAVHPLAVEPVAWISGREEVLTVFFVLLSLHSYIGVPRRKDRLGRSLMTWLFCLLACLSNVAGAVMPALLLAYDGCFHRQGERRIRTWFRGAMARTWPAWLIAAGAVGLKLSWTGALWGNASAAAPPDLSIPERALVMLDTYQLNLRSVLWPAELTIAYPNAVPGTLLSPGVLLGALCLLLTTLALWFSRKTPMTCLGLFWFVASLAPGSQMIPHHVFRADRFLYLPLVGLALAIGTGPMNTPTARRWPRATLGIAIGAVVLLALRSAFQVPVWENGVTLFSHAIDCGADPTIAHRVLGCALAREGRHQEAAQHFAAALPGEPGEAEVHYNLANSLRNLGRLEAAKAHYSEAFKRKPADANILNNLAAVLATQGKWEEAADVYSSALVLDPGSAHMRSNLGVTLAAQQRIADAVAQFSRAIELNPHLVSAHLGLGAAFVKQKTYQEAVRHFSEVLRISPGHPKAAQGLRNALHALGQDQAISPQTNSSSSPD